MSRRLLSLVFITYASAMTFVGCTALRPGAPVVLPAGTTAPLVRGSMMPETPDQDLLYVSDQSASVSVYTYPQGKHAGKLTGFISPLGECVDAEGDVFIVAYTSRSYESSVIYEFAHGGTSPIATLEDPGGGNGCAIDSTSGDLAVANGIDNNNPYGKYGSVAVYPNAQGYPTVYYSSEVGFAFCGYDGQGNLYLSAPSRQYDYNELFGLQYGSSNLERIGLNAKLYDNRYAGSSVQWDGRHMVVTSDPTHRPPYGPLLAYQLKIHGKRATVVGTTELSTEKDKYGGQAWLQEKTYLATTFLHGRAEAAMWSYPRGGKPRRAIPLGPGLPWGLAVSRSSTSEKDQYLGAAAIYNGR